MSDNEFVKSLKLQSSPEYVAECQFNKQQNDRHKYYHIWKKAHKLINRWFIAIFFGPSFKVARVCWILWASLKFWLAGWTLNFYLPTCICVCHQSLKKQQVMWNFDIATSATPWVTRKTSEKVLLYYLARQVNKVNCLAGCPTMV